MDIMGHHQLYCHFPSFEQLIKAIAVLVVFHVWLVLAVRCDVDFQLVVYLFRLVDLLIATELILKAINIFIYQPDRALRLLWRCLPVYLKNLLGDRNIFHFTNFLLFCFTFTYY